MIHEGFMKVPLRSFRRNRPGTTGVDAKQEFHLNASEADPFADVREYSEIIAAFLFSDSQCPRSYSAVATRRS